MTITVRINGYTGNAMEPFISRDGKFLFFNNKNDGSEDCNLWWATGTNDPTVFNFKGPVSADTKFLEGVASLDSLNNFYFITNRNPPNTIYQGKWNNQGNTGLVFPIRGVTFTAPEFGMDAEISYDGQMLYYAPAVGSQSIPQAYITSAHKNPDGSFTKSPIDYFSNVNLGGTTYAPCTTPDELTLFLTKFDPSISNTPQIYFSTRPDKTSVFSTPSLLPIPGFVEGPSIRSDGSYLYFHQLNPLGVFEIASIPLR